MRPAAGFGDVSSTPHLNNILREERIALVEISKEKAGIITHTVDVQPMGNSFAISAHRLRVAIYGQDPKLISSRLYLGCYCFAWKNLLFLQQSEGTGYDDGDSS